GKMGLNVIGNDPEHNGSDILGVSYPLQRSILTMLKERIFLLNSNMIYVFLHHIRNNSIRTIIFPFIYELMVSEVISLCVFIFICFSCYVGEEIERRHRRKYCMLFEVRAVAELVSFEGLNLCSKELDKIEYLAINSNERENLILEEGIQIKQVKQTKYLGIIMDNIE
ncbi:hypothetical protein L9F63_001524, partial [Diploptera punctata]